MVHTKFVIFPVAPLWISFSIGSMYGIFTYIWLKSTVNVGLSSIYVYIYIEHMGYVPVEIWCDR